MPGKTLRWRYAILSLGIMAALSPGARAQGLKGDVSGDGGVNLKDAVLLAQHLRDPAGQPLTDAQKGAADVFPVPGVGGRTVGDGQLTPDDARQLLRFVVGLIGESALRGEVTPVITRLDPASGPVGTRVEIEGQFFAAGKPKENVVTFGGVEATVSEATETRLVTQVPANAATGPVLVTTPLGRTPGDQIFTVTGAAQGRFEPPAGMNAADFEIVNTYGGPTRLRRQRQSAEFTIPVREEAPLITVAAPKDETRQTFFYAVTLSNNQPFTINAASTAQSLVFMNPFLMTLDPLLAEHVLGIIRQDAKVQALAQVLTQIYPQGGDPFANSTFLQAYEDAVISVGNSAAVRSLAQGRQAAHRQADEERNASVYSVDLDFLQVTGSDRRREIQGIPLNPVDWLVSIIKIDVDKTFPNGRRDFDPAWREARLVDYVREAGFEERRTVSADLLASRLNPLAFLFKWLSEQVSGALVDETIEFPDRDAIYVMGGVGPALTPEEERVRAAGSHVVALTMNLLSAAMDLLSGLIDLEVFDFTKAEWDEVIAKLTLEVTKIAPTIQGIDDFIKAAVDLTFSFLEALAGMLKKKGLEALEGATKAAARAIGKTFTGVLKWLEVASALGQVAERASGLLRTTPMESAYIVVGNPFQLEIASVTPPGGSPGSELQIVIRKARFDLNNRKDRVLFTGILPGNVGFEFDGQVTAVQDLADGQSLTVRVPQELATIEDGEYDLILLAQGRRGEGKFQLVSRPTVTEMTPTEGFAAVDDFLGNPFGGTFVGIKGFGFSEEDTFAFAGGAEATIRDPSVDGVIVRVPQGAQSGPVTIRRQDQSEGQSPKFTVFPAPVIDEMTPDRGPVGTLVLFTVQNVGRDLSAVAVQFNGLDPGSVNFLRGNQVGVIVPLGAQTGLVTLLTPAGQAQRDFTVEEGRALGSSIFVGGNSVITLARALAFANGAATPADDNDVDGEGNSTDPPFEEGDFVSPDYGAGANPRWLVGAEFEDTIFITGEVAGSGTLAGDFDTVNGGTVQGTLTITGHHNNVSATFRGGGGHGVVLRGPNNGLNVTCDGNGGDGVRIEGGKSNTVSALATRNGGNGVTLTGGALGNEVTVSTRATDPNTGEVIPDSGNQGHGVLLVGDASANTIGGADISGNGGDGIRLDGAGVRNNEINNGNALANSGNGITLTNGASDNRIGFTAHENGQSGIALLGGDGGVPQRTQVSGVCNRNADYGVLVSGIADEEGATQINANASDNRKADLRLEKGTRGIRYEGFLSGGPVGLEMDGTDVVDNYVQAQIFQCTGNGAVITKAQRNDLRLIADECAEAGVVLSGAKENQLIAAAKQNQGDGLRLTDGAEDNRVHAANLNENRNGLVVEGGSQNNVFNELRSRVNREHGVVLQGAGTSGNRITHARIGLDGPPYGNGGDGIRIQGGASENNVGTDASPGAEIRASVGAGIRIAGAGTWGNVILGCLITLVDREQEAGIIVEDKAEDTIIGGFTTKERNQISFNKEGIIVRSGARKVVIQNNKIEANSTAGIRVDNASGVLIGGGDPRSPNDISYSPAGVQLQGSETRYCQVSGNHIFENGDGVVLLDGATDNLIGNDNLIKLNDVGVRVAGAFRTRILQNTMDRNRFAGVFFTDNAADNLVRGNDLFWNGLGVQVEGASTLRNSIRNNSITANDGKGIWLSAGGNNNIPPPVLTGYSSNAVIGTANVPDGSTVEIFKDPEDEGEEPIATAGVFSGRFRVPMNLKPAQVGLLFQLTGTVTDLSSNTSEFGRLVQEPLVPVSQIAFTSTRDGNPEIYLQDGFHPFPIRLTEDPADDHSPAFAPDAQKIAFVSTRDGNPNIYTRPTEPGGDVTRLTNHSAPDYDPAWSPDGSKIAFVSEREGNPEIYVMNADGSGVTRLTNHAGADRSPTFSPDGTKIAFASNRTGNFEVFVMNADGSSPRALTSNGAADTRPAWSPDGDLLAFVSERDNNPEVYTLRTDGTQATRLTDHPAADVDPSWLAGGQGLVFASNRDEGFELYLLGRTGGAATRLTVSSGDNTQPHAARR